MTLKKNNKFCFHYIGDWAYTVIYWSITLFLICLVVIISLEVGRPTVISVLCGLIALIAVIIAYRKIIVIDEEQLVIRGIYKKRDQHFALKETTFRLNHHQLMMTYGNKIKKVYITKKTREQFIVFANRYNIHVDRA